MFETRLATVVDSGALGIPKARCRVFSLEKRPLNSRRCQFTSAAYPTKYLLFTHG